MCVNVNRRFNMFIRRPLAFSILASICLIACDTSGEKADRARNQAQVAFEAGNLLEARRAMLAAVQAKDDDAGLWLLLGRAQLGLGDVAGAYQSYARAVELDRADAEALQAIADLSLVAGRLEDAERYAEQLQLLQPGSAGPIATKGFIDLARNKPQQAVAKADAVLALRPFDPAGSILKARALTAQNEFAAAAQLLEEQLKQRGPTASILKTLLRVYQGHENEAGILNTKRRLSELDPDNIDLAYDYAEQLYRSGDKAVARGAATRVIDADPSSKRLAKVLDLWAAFESREQAVTNSRDLAASATPANQVLHADFLIDQGEPRMAEALLQSQEEATISAETADAVAVFARARSRLGDETTALRRLDAVLAFDPGNDLALRARVDIDLAHHCVDQTLANVRRLVADNPASSEDRLRLASCYMGRGNRQLAETTLRAAFNEIPGDESLYRALQSFLKRSGEPTQAALLTKRYQEQRRALAAAAMTKT